MSTAAGVLTKNHDIVNRVLPLTLTIEQILSFDKERWGVWAVWFAHPMRNRADAHKNLVAVLPELKGRWEEWKRWLSQDVP